MLNRKIMMNELIIINFVSLLICVMWCIVAYHRSNWFWIVTTLVLISLLAYLLNLFGGWIEIDLETHSGSLKFIFFVLMIATSANHALPYKPAYQYKCDKKAAK